jgi:hypothetical protein
MIHRIHKYDVNRRDGVGGFLGYVNLCEGYIDVSHIYSNLIESNFISPSWFSKKELSIIANGITKLGKQIWILQRRTPREYLFSIYPIELEQKQDEKMISNSYFTTNTINFAANPAYTYSNIIQNLYNVEPVRAPVGFIQEHYLHQPILATPIFTPAMQIPAIQGAIADQIIYDDIDHN